MPCIANYLSNFLRVDGVILLVRADESDIHDSVRVVDPNDYGERGPFRSRGPALLLKTETGARSA
jgi:hypothetical protein